MKLWKRASGVFKDRQSLWRTTFTRKTALRSPDIEAAVIKATNHDEFYLDYRNSERVFALVRKSPAYVKPVVEAIAIRMEKTRSWVVALKGLMLMHGIFSCKVVAVQRIGKLPFDLSNFKDRHSHDEVIWAYSDLIRAYYTFLDEKSSFIFQHAQEKRKLLRLPKIGDDQTPQPISDSSLSLMQYLVSLQSMQGLLDLLLQIKPESYSMESYTMVSPIILEAMDHILFEIFDVYSRICAAIEMVLTRISSAGTDEATLAFKILRIAVTQSEQLYSYFKFCKDMGVSNARDCPIVKPISEKDIQELENMLGNGGFVECDPDNENCKSLIVVDQINSTLICSDLDQENDKSLVVAEMNNVQEEEKSNLKTIITSEWQVFEDDFSSMNPFPTPGRPFLALEAPPQENHSRQAAELPDLISFD